MILAYHNVSPKFGEHVFVAPDAVVIGDVKIGRDCSIWFGVILRGDVNYIRIGERTNIQDGTICHGTLNKYPLLIGNAVTVGHGAILHGCAIKDYSLIGIGAKILDGAEVGPYSLVAAGSLIREGTIIPPGTMAAGVPAVVKRILRPEERDTIKFSAERYVKYKNEYLAMRVQHSGL